MNKKLKNYIIFGIFLALLFLSTFSNLFGTNFIWPKESNYAVPFNGLFFDQPTNVSNFNVTRSVEKSDYKNLVKYDINFTYTGQGSNMRIYGIPVRQIFFKNDVQPVKSNATLRGEYEKVNKALFEKLKLKDLYSKLDEYNFTTISQIRVPLTEETKEYSFSLYYEPKNLVYRGEKKLSELSAFITNARVDQFTDKELTEKNSPLKSFVKQDSQSGIYINSLELTNDSLISRISILNNINTIVCVASILAMLALIWIDRPKFSIIYMILMMLILVTFHKFIDLGVSTFAILFLYPIFGYIAACFSKLMAKNELKLNANELKQSLAFTIVFTVLVIIVFIIPRAFV